MARFGSACLLVALALAGCDRKPALQNVHPVASRPPQLVVPEHAAYTGAYIDFGEREDNVTLEAIEDFEQLVGKHQAIVAFSSFWGEQHFPAEQAHIVAGHGSVPLIFWSPWDWPYKEDTADAHTPNKFGLDNIVAGKCDAYIDQWADGAKAFGGPLFVSLCNEANGYWFPWSASHYGGAQPVVGADPPRYTGPEFFKRAYRYIVDRVRARGATNVLWVLHMNNYSDPYAPWNTMQQFYPGDEYVDWLGLSVYGQLFPDDEKWSEFENMMQGPYEELCKLNATKPVMVVEWGVGEYPEHGSKPDWLTEGFEQMQRDCPRVRAAVYWHERWQNGDIADSDKSMMYSNLRVNSSPGALQAYREGVANPYWLGAPIFR